MNKQWLIYFTDHAMTSVGLILFLTLFFGVLAWTYRPYSKKIYQHIENLPLNSDSEV